MSREEVRIILPPNAASAEFDSPEGMLYELSRIVITVKCPNDRGGGFLGGEFDIPLPMIYWRRAGWR